MKKELLDEIINLKSRKQILEAECGTIDHDMHLFTQSQINNMDNDMQRMNVCVTLDAVSKRIKEDEKEFREECRE